MKRRWILAVLALAGLAAAGVFWWYSPTFELPEPNGPHRVGVKAFALVDESRHGLLGTPESEPRRIPIRVWYPVADDATGATRRYLDAYEAAALGENLGKGERFFAYLSRIDTHSILDAPVLDAPAKSGSGAWPLVLFNHGFWCYPEQNTAMMEQLASHGYVAVSIGHPGDSIEARFADGTVVKTFSGADEKRDTELQAGMAAFMGGTTGDARMAGLKLFEAASTAHRIGDSARIWRDDNLFVFQALRDGQVPGDVRDVAAAVDYAKLGVVGMSFGGSTAPSVCEALAECKAAVNLDGESFDFSMYNVELRAPLLMLLTGQRFTDAQFDDPSVNPMDYAYERWAHAGERDDIVRMRVSSLQHVGLLDLLLSAPRPGSAEMYGTIDGQRGMALIGDAVLQFLDRHVRGKKEVDFPRSFFAEYPEATPHDASHVRQWWLKRNVDLGCSEESIRAAAPLNDPKSMRLGDWITAPTGC